MWTLPRQMKANSGRCCCSQLSPGTQPTCRPPNEQTRSTNASPVCLPTCADGRVVFEDLIRRKELHFADNRRMILDFDLTMTADGPHLQIMSTLPEEA